MIPERDTPASAPDVRTVAKGGILQFLGTGTNRAAGVLFVAIAIRLLGATNFGIYRQISLLLGKASTIATLGFDAALLRSIAQARARGETAAIRDATRTAVASVMTISLVLFLTLFFAADPIAGAFADHPSRQREMSFLIRLGAAYVPLSALTQVLSVGMVGYKTVGPSVLVDHVLQPISFLLLSSAAIAAGYGVAGAVGGLMVSALVALLVALSFFRRLFRAEKTEVPTQERRPPAYASLRSMTAFALPRAGSRALVLGGLGSLILGLRGTDREVALFAVASSLQLLVFIFPQAFLGIWQPMVVDLMERGEMERLRTLYQTVTRWVASCAFGFIIALVVFPEPFVEILGGETVQEAAVLTSIMALGALFDVGTGPCGMLITMAGYPMINLVNNIAVTSLYVLAGWLVVPTHGVMGMAVVHGAATALKNLVLVLAAKRLTGLQPFGRSFLKAIVAMLLAGLVLGAWRLLVERALVLDLVGLVLAAAMYVGFLWMTGIDAEDRIVLERLRTRLGGWLPRALS